METYYCATCYTCVKDYNEEKDCCIDCSKYTNVNENPYWCKHRHKNIANKFYAKCRNGLLGKEEMSFEWLCGNSVINVRKYLEEKFVEKMTWENYGEWHIDHIRPVSSFDLLQNKEIRKCWYYTNLQPLWGNENSSKHNKWDGQFPWYYNAYKSDYNFKIIRNRVYSGMGSEEDKEIMRDNVRKNFFDCDFKCKGLELLNTEALKAIRWLKFGCNIDFKNISRYQVGTAEQYYFCFKQIFDKLGINIIDTSKDAKDDKTKAELFDTLIPVEKIKELDINLLKPLLEKGLGLDHIKMLRKVLRLVYLNIERSQSRINGILITMHYKIIDNKCIWKEIHEF